MANILDLVTKVDRPIFTIDGTECSMRHPDELSMAEFHQLSSSGSKLVKLADAYGDDPDKAFTSISNVMNELIDLVAPDVPAELREKLNPFHVQKLLETFMGLAQSRDTLDEQPNPAK